MFELFASRLSRCVVALAVFFAAVAAFTSPASARPHRHSAERHAYAHHASRHHHYRRARSSRFDRGAAQLQASGFGNSFASYDPNANGGGMAVNASGAMAMNGHAPAAMSRRSGRAMSESSGTAMSAGFGGGSGLVSEARRYVGGNPTGRGSLWCARFM